MLFNSVEFLIFLPVVFFLYWFIFKSLRWQNVLIVVVSYIFYGWWDWRFLFLIALTSTYSYLCGLWIEHAEGNRRLQKSISASSIVLNLSILCLFKYFNFFRENIVSLLGCFDIHLDWPVLNVLLPVGISFYTFQALSYTIDVYRKKVKPTKDIISFFAYISFFPQLVAGPIERATNLLPQILHHRKFNYASAVDGVQQILWGFFKKLVIADNCSVIVNEIFSNYATMGSWQLICGGFFFSFQIYGDFSGYSDIAIGTSRLFGINLMRNFHFPYLSRDIAEFWRRWHISLNTWFRDYIYIPLGGSRCGLLKNIRNVFVIFLVSGFWHGANWTFITWGFIHALLFVPLLISGKNRKHCDAPALNGFYNSAKEALQIVSTFCIVMFTWIIFRAENISQAYNYVFRIFQFVPSGSDLPNKSIEVAFYILFLWIVEWIQREKEYGLQIQSIKSKPLRIAIYTFLLVFIQMTMGESNTFIYFQF